ncbi:hypothetical protein QWZ13_06345 [Reinekea marina]|uniref:hypothetical protein n=1 Tax=Reinekea marina TaxID=1310421 RepID=UPI0025B30D5A|nr:hypothetical protein [Reinekea marina]MDN3648528.1 hypothetical protein [Reinekea marina]
MREQRPAEVERATEAGIKLQVNSFKLQAGSKHLKPSRLCVALSDLAFIKSCGCRLVLVWIK